VIGPLVFGGSVALTALEIVAWGLLWYWWAVIGGVIFSASGFAIIWGQQKEINKLKRQLDDKLQRPTMNVKIIEPMKLHPKRHDK